jgi:hypothetical protein
MNSATKEVVNLWGQLFPVPGYTSGFLNKPGLYILTPDNLESAYKKISNVREDIRGKESDEDLQFCADRLLTLFKSVLKNAGPTYGVTQAGDGFYYVLVKESSKPQWLEEYLTDVKSLLAFETKHWAKEKFSYEIKRGCLDSAGYLRGCFDAVNRRWPIEKQTYHAVCSAIEEYKKVFYEQGLDTADIDTLLTLFARNETTPKSAKGYPDLLNDQFNLGSNAEEIQTMAKDLLESELPILKKLAAKMAKKLKMPESSTIEQVWEEQSKHYAVPNEEVMSEKIVSVGNAFGNKYILRIDKTDHVSLKETPSYLTAMVTGGEDRAVNYLTDKPSSVLYYTSSKNTSLLTMINIIVHELSHGYNFVKSAQHAGSPLLNLFTQIVEVLTEGMAFYREYQYYDAAQKLLDKTDLNNVQQDYLNLYGETYEKQEQAILGAKFETYIWRIIRYIRALCDTEVNGGKKTYTEFLDWAAEYTSISKNYLHGECFTFLSQPGYAPCYTVGGKAYQKYQELGLKNNVSEIDFNTISSNIGFMPWVRGVEQLERIAKGTLTKIHKG